MKIFSHGDKRYVLEHVVMFGKHESRSIQVRYADVTSALYLHFDTEGERDNAFNRMEAEIESIS